MELCQDCDKMSEKGSEWGWEGSNGIVLPQLGAEHAR